MKILHISRTMGQGGAEKVVYQLCKDNTTAEQVVISAGGYYEAQLKQIGVRHYNIPDMDKKDIATILSCLCKILYVVKKEHIDIIHSHHRMAAFYARIVALLTRCVRVYTAHNVFLDKRLLLRIALNGSRIIAVGNGVKKNLIEVYGFNDANIIVIPNSIEGVKTGIQNDRLAKLRDDGYFLVGTIGRITEQKGIDIFIKAVAEVLKTDPLVMGVIVGDGEERKAMEQLAFDLGIEEHIVFLGYQPYVLDIISQLDLTVLSSRWEGLPLTPIEVFSQGKTIIASDISGNNEIVTDQYNGLLFEKDNHCTLAEKIRQLICNREQLETLERNASKTYEQQYCYHAFIDAYQRVYRKS